MSKAEEIAALVQERMSAAAGKTLGEVDVSDLPDRVAAWLRQNVPGFECATAERARLDGDTLHVNIVLPADALVGYLEPEEPDPNAGPLIYTASGGDGDDR